MFIPGYIIISIGLTCLRITSILFVKSACRINSEYHCDKLLRQLIPTWGNCHQGILSSSKMVPAVKLRLTQFDFHRKRFLNIAFFNEVSQQLRLNLFDYVLQEIIEAKVWGSRFRVIALERVYAIIRNCWPGLPLDVFDQTFDSFRVFFKKVIEAHDILRLLYT